MIPDYLIYDELIREREMDSDWQPEPLHLPVYVPNSHDEEPEVEDDDDVSRGVIIIDMCGGEDF